MSESPFRAPVPLADPYAQHMTLRDQFAAAALNGILADPKRTGTFVGYASYVYALADAMLAERAKERKP